MPSDKTPTPSTVPDYMETVYHWAYVDAGHVDRLDRNWVVRALLFFNDRRLMRAYLARVHPGMRVWQAAHVYGDLVRRVAERCGPTGCFHLCDVTPIQVAHARTKLAGLAQAEVFLADARTFAGVGAGYDVLCSFFLLHEVPDAWKTDILDNMLCQLPANGELLIVDYHQPAWWQPVGYVLRLVNRWLEPFAHVLWQRELASFASRPEAFVWEKRTLFGGVYQLVRVTRRPSVDEVHQAGMPR